MKDILIFKRVEKKYRINESKKNMLLAMIIDRLKADPYGNSTICSVYLDTPDRLLIRNSIDARTYKEKLRIRSYGVPQKDTQVFLEIKKKYKGVVHKRRVKMPLTDALEYVSTGKTNIDSQIMREIDYAMHFYGHPAPSMLIAYERDAYFGKEDDGLRLTFDRNIRFREQNTDLTQGDHGEKILPDGEYVLEIKTNGGMPMWLSSALDKLKIYPLGFSKYANAHYISLEKNKALLLKGEQ